MPQGNPTKSLLYILPVQDWNGAIFDGLDENKNFLRELSQDHQIIPIWASGKRDLAEKVRSARETAQLPIEAVLIEAHGTKDSILLEDKKNLILFVNPKTWQTYSVFYLGTPG